jgi:hypothetical protein
MRYCDTVPYACSSTNVTLVLRFVCLLDEFTEYAGDDDDTNGYQVCIVV